MSSSPDVVKSFKLSVPKHSSVLQATCTKTRQRVFLKASCVTPEKATLNLQMQRIGSARCPESSSMQSPVSTKTQHHAFLNDIRFAGQPSGELQPEQDIAMPLIHSCHSAITSDTPAVVPRRQSKSRTRTRHKPGGRSPRSNAAATGWPSPPTSIVEKMENMREQEARMVESGIFGMRWEMASRWGHTNLQSNQASENRFVFPVVTV